MDNIREKLAKLIEESRIRKTENEGYCICGSHIIADHLIANGLTIQKWTPANDPPKENGRYNVYIADQVHAHVDAVSFYKDGVGGLHKNVWARYDCEAGFYEVKHITHWMPLPTLPKESERMACKYEDTCKDYPLYRGCGKYKKTTNADRIRAMSDEELGNFLHNVVCKFMCEYCKEYERIKTAKGHANCNGECDKAYLEWLKQIAK